MEPSDAMQNPYQAFRVSLERNLSSFVTESKLCNIIISLTSSKSVFRKWWQSASSLRSLISERTFRNIRSDNEGSFKEGDGGWKITNSSAQDGNKLLDDVRLCLVDDLKKIHRKEVKDLKEKQNVENSFSGSNEQFAEIVHLKQNLFEQVQEKDCLIKTVSELKNKLKFEENRNIEREIELEKKIKQLDNIIFKRGQSAQTVRMLTNSKICYDHSSKQALGFEKPFCMKKARESKPKLYDVPDSDETLELSEKSRSKMLLKEQDPLFVKHRINTKPINYDILNNDYYKRFVRQTDLYSEHAYWKATSVPALDPSHSSTTVIVEVPKELQQTTATAITGGHWGFLNFTKACFRDEFIPFIKIKRYLKSLRPILAVEDLPMSKSLLSKWKRAVEQHRSGVRTFEVYNEISLVTIERLLAQAIDKDIVRLL
ncbi:hypothetical protein Tco_1254445 [Tanacetum coccineum]